MSDQPRQPGPEKRKPFAKLWLESQHALGGFVCAHVPDHDLADDILQEVAELATERFDQYDHDRPFIAWLIGIARNRIIDNVRSEKRHSDRRADEDSVELSTEAEVERTSDQMLVADALRELPERSREVIMLAYFHDLTHPQIAERTNIPLGTVKSDIRRGLARIRRHLETQHD